MEINEQKLRQQAIKEVTQNGRLMFDVARQHDISTKRVSLWRTQNEVANRPRQSRLMGERLQLQRRIRQLSREFSLSR
ncbi:transposase [Shewanella algae]|uniref:transposase n=1 Tax=Shewanella algae TaxID=38313 RepID=UPI0031F5C9BA